MVQDIFAQVGLMLQAMPDAGIVRVQMQYCVEITAKDVIRCEHTSNWPCPICKVRSNYIHGNAYMEPKKFACKSMWHGMDNRHAVRCTVRQHGGQGGRPVCHAGQGATWGQHGRPGCHAGQGQGQ